MNSWLSGWITKAKRRMLRKLPVGCSSRGLMSSSSRISVKSSSDTSSGGLPRAARIIASMVLMPTTCSNSLGETSITRLTLHLVKKARRSSSTAEVIRVLPARLAALPTAFNSAKVPTMTCDLATSIAARLRLKPGSEASSSSPDLPLSAHLLPLAYSSSWSSEPSMAGAPVWNSASAKLRLRV